MAELGPQPPDRPLQRSHIGHLLQGQRQRIVHTVKLARVREDDIALARAAAVSGGGGGGGGGMAAAAGLAGFQDL